MVNNTTLLKYMTSVVAYTALGCYILCIVHTAKSQESLSTHLEHLGGMAFELQVKAKPFDFCQLQMIIIHTYRLQTAIGFLPSVELI